MPSDPTPTLHTCDEKRGAIVGSTRDTARCGCPGGVDLDEEPRCYWVAGNELCVGAEEAYAAGIAEGRRQATACVDALAELVRLKLSPRGAAYERDKVSAWQRAREALAVAGSGETDEQPEPDAFVREQRDGWGAANTGQSWTGAAIDKDFGPVESNRG